MLPLAALFSGILSLGFVGIGTLSALLPAVLAGSPFALALTLLLAGPPILWLGSFFLLQRRRRAGWRMFALASLLATVWAIWSLQIFQLAFDLLFVYAAIQARDAYRY
jgi:glucose dehydrogenase